MATVLENSANISYSYDGAQNTQGAASNTTSTLLVEPCSVTITKQALTQSYRNGDTVSYVIRIENTGSSALSGLTVTDNLGAAASPKPLAYYTGSLNVYVDGNPVTVSPNAGDTLEFTLSTVLASGSNVIAVYSATINSDADSITNTVTVTASGATASCTVNESTTATISAESYAELSIYKSASADTVTSGDSLSYTFTIMNRGSAEATNVVLTDTLPAVFTVQSVSVTDSSGTTVYDESDYTIDATTNTITLPNATSNPITVAAATSAGPGIATVTLTGVVG